MINMQPIYRRKLAKSEITCMAEESTETLNASFYATDWDIFVNNAGNIDELVDTVTEYMKFNIDMLLPKKTLELFVDELAKHISMDKQTDVAILDFSKTFDVILHKCLLHKFDFYGIQGLIKWARGLQ